MFVRLGTEGAQFVNLATAAQVVISGTGDGQTITVWFPGMPNAVQGSIHPDEAYTAVLFLNNRKAIAG